jgi:hypothetical protein
MLQVVVIVIVVMTKVTWGPCTPADISSEHILFNEEVLLEHDYLDNHHKYVIRSQPWPGLPCITHLHAIMRVGN